MESKFQCLFCDSQYSRKRNLKAHIKKLHNENVYLRVCEKNEESEPSKESLRLDDSREVDIWSWRLDSFSEVPLLSIIPDRSDHEHENLSNKSGQICPFCQSQDFDNHNCEMYEKALSQQYCTLCQVKVHKGFMKSHLEHDCKVAKFFGIQIPQPYIEPEVSTYSRIMIQDVYSLERSTGKLHCSGYKVSHRLKSLFYK